MKLISSADTLNFLCKSAPRPWVKRMLRWMIYDGELEPYFASGRIVPRSRVGSILSEIEGIDLNAPIDERDILTRQYFNESVSSKIVGRQFLDFVEDDPIEWNESEEPHATAAGYFILAEDVDWEGGRISVEIHHEDVSDNRLFWDADDHLATMFPHANFDVTLWGMCFRWDNIEMLQPGIELTGVEEASKMTVRARVGRPRTWDWDGVMTYLIGVAQHPDGLPSGAGAQAQIEKLIGDWFVKATGNSPSSSQIRASAQKIMASLNSPKM
jgi:hypothetical protein